MNTKWNDFYEILNPNLKRIEIKKKLRKRNYAKFIVLVRWIHDQEKIKMLSIRRITKITRVNRQSIYRDIVPFYEDLEWCQIIKSKGKMYIAPRKVDLYDEYLEDIEIGMQNTEMKILNTK